MPELPDAIARINALTANARNTWFALLGVLVFVGITLMGVEHIDFYGVDRATQLPLVNVEVPTRFFFLAAPILTAAIYGYFHLYLIRLWDALSVAEPRTDDDRPLGDVIAPWVVTDAALHLRSRKRGDGCTSSRPLENAATALNFALAWGLGLFVLASLWWLSMPARSFLMTSVAGLSLVVCIGCGYISWRAMHLRMAKPPSEDGLPIDEPLTAVLPVLAFYAVTFLSLVRTEQPQPGIPLAALSLAGEDIVERPEGWLPHEIARKEFRAAWCEREAVEACNALTDAQESAFASELQSRRATALAYMGRPNWNKRGREKPDLRGAELSRAFLSGADLEGAQMERARFVDTHLEGANLSGAQMQDANLTGARMEGANLIGALMEGAVLRRAQMEGAVLRRAQMESADLSWAQMAGANLSNAQMESADLSWAQMAEANLFAAQMEGADLSFAQMEGANLFGTQMAGANLFGAQVVRTNLSYSLLTGTGEPRSVSWSFTNLAGSTNEGGAARLIDLQNIRFDTATDFRNAFLDGSVRTTAAFAKQMGGDLERPCQWWPAPLADIEFYGRWRGWIQHHSKPEFVPWELFAPDDWHAVTPIPPPEGCAWKTGPMPGGDAPEGP